MPDTQWPRYYVFEQPDEQGPLIHAGSVHAPDREMALLTARDIFGRRPMRTTMWVVRDRNIFSKTREEIDQRNPLVREKKGEQTVKQFHVFIKTSHKGVCVRAGEVRGTDYEDAFEKAQTAFSEPKVLLWWIICDDDVIRTDPADDPVLYGSSPGKDYRHESHYPVRTMMMQLKNKKRAKDD